MRKFIRSIIIVLIASASVSAQESQGPHRVPARRDQIVREQPNGYALYTYLRGDEHGHYMTTIDGWEIRQTKKGWYKYAKRTRKGDIKTSCRKAHNADKRSKCEIKWLDKHGVKKN